jgi:hypothetical protein
MADIQGMGNCGICQLPIQDPKTGVPSPVRHFRDHILAHKNCHESNEAHKLTDDYRREQAEQRVQAAQNKLNVAVNELNAATKALEELE